MFIEHIERVYFWTTKMRMQKCLGKLFTVEAKFLKEQRDFFRNVDSSDYFPLGTWKKTSL